MRILKCFLFFFGLILSGCVSVEYVGQKFPPREEGSSVVFFPNPGELPEGYRVIGRGVINAPDGMMKGDARTALIEKAWEVGADAVCVISFQRQLVGSYEAQEVVPQTVVTAQSGAYGTNDAGSQVYVNSFGQPQGMNVQRIQRFRVIVKAEYLLEDEHYNREMARLKNLHEERLKEERETRNIDSPAAAMASEKAALDAKDAALMKKQGKLMPVKEETAAETPQVKPVLPDESKVKTAPSIGDKDPFDQKTPTFHSIE